MSQRLFNDVEIKSKVSYKGGIKGVLHGMGTLSYEKGDLTAEFTDGKILGIGTFTYRNQSIFKFYEGTFMKEYENSAWYFKHGKLFFANGNIYEGDFKQDLPYGSGILIYKGNHYIGQFENGCLMGDFTVNMTNGDSYVGPIDSHVNMTGQGYYRYANGDSDRGEFNKILINGTKTRQFNDSTFMINVINGIDSNQMTLVSPQGDTYIGEFKAGLYHGLGKLTFKNGNIYTGQFKHGVLNGPGEQIFSNGSRIKGNFVNGEISGLVTYIGSTGVSITGFTMTNQPTKPILNEIESLVDQDYTLLCLSPSQQLERSVSGSGSPVLETKDHDSETSDPVSKTRDSDSETRDPVNKLSDLCKAKLL